MPAPCSRGLTRGRAMDTLVLALDLFRNTYGCLANPEDLPYEWQECIEHASEMLDQEAT